MIYRREGMRHQCWSLVIVSTERGRQVGDEVLHHGLPRSRESPVYRRGHGESVFACASTLVRRGEYRAQTGIWRLLGFVSVRTIKGRSSSGRRTMSSAQNWTGKRTHSRVLRYGVRPNARLVILAGGAHYIHTRTH